MLRKFIHILSVIYLMTARVEYSNIQSQEHKRNQDGIALLRSRFKRQDATPTHKQRPGGYAMSKDSIRYLYWHEVPANPFPPCTVRNTRTTQNIMRIWHVRHKISWGYDTYDIKCHKDMTRTTQNFMRIWHGIEMANPYLGFIHGTQVLYRGTMTLSGIGRHWAGTHLKCDGCVELVPRSTLHFLSKWNHFSILKLYFTFLNPSRE